MSAWYIFSVLGFYPVAPGSNQYVIGSPCIKNASIKLENGKVFYVEVENYSPKNIYIKEIYLNGMRLNKTYIKHDQIMAGGKLRFVMSPQPNKNLGISDWDIPYSLEQ